LTLKKQKPVSRKAMAMKQIGFRCVAN